MPRVRIHAMIWLIMTGLLSPVFGLAKLPITLGASNDPSCDFHTIQEAVDAAKNDPFQTPDTIYIASNIDSDIPNVARETVTIHQQALTIVGGLQSCNQEPNPAAFTFISGGRPSDQGKPVITITGF